FFLFGIFAEILQQTALNFTRRSRQMGWNFARSLSPPFCSMSQLPQSSQGQGLSCTHPQSGLTTLRQPVRVRSGCQPRQTTDFLVRFAHDRWRSVKRRKTSHTLRGTPAAFSYSFADLPASRNSAV